MKANSIEIINAYKKQFNEIDDRYCIAVTIMTRKIKVNAYDSAKNAKKRHMNKDEVNACVKEYLKRLSKQVFNSAYRKFGKLVEYVQVVEGNDIALNKAHKRLDLHAHLILKKTDNLTVDEFIKKAMKARRLTNDIESIDIKHADKGWNSYCTKAVSNERDIENIIF